MRTTAPSGTTTRATWPAIFPASKRRFIIAICAALTVAAIFVGVFAGTLRRGPADAASLANADAAVIATAVPGAPTPTPLANRPTPTAAPTAAPPPTAFPPTQPPNIVAPAAQPAPAQAPAPAPRGNGKGKEKGKD